MKKFRGVFDGIRQTVTYSSKPDTSLEIDDSLKSDKFHYAKMVRHGFPHAPSCVAYDPLQRLIAIGTKFGVVCVLGRPGVDMFISHDSEPVVVQILFIVNDGSLITICSNQTISHWSFRQKKPELLRSLQFNREGLTYCYTPYQSKWLYCGTDKGNVYMLQLEKFELSGYVINWNKAMELSRRTHPGAVVHISDNSLQPNNILIGFDAGLIVLWDLKAKTALARFAAATPIHTVSWFSDARSFVCGHVDGSLSTWNCKQPQRPVSIVYPHGQLPNGTHEECRPIMKIDWMSSKSQEAFTVFTGGMPLDRMTGRMPCLSISRGRSLTVLEMEHNIVDFVCMSETPFSHDFQDPFAVVVLLQNDLVVIDLTSGGYPCFENPYPMDVHESPVTCCQMLADCPHDLIPTFYTIGQRTRTNTRTVASSVASADQVTLATAMQNNGMVGAGGATSIGSTVMSILNNATGASDNSSNTANNSAQMMSTAYQPASGQQSDGQPPTNAARTNAHNFSTKPWPITGGVWGNAITSSQTLVITGHADGSLKFWDASATNFQILYKVKTNKIFERHVRRRVRDASSGNGTAPNANAYSNISTGSGQPALSSSSANGVGDTNSTNNSSSSSATAGSGTAGLPPGSSSLAAKSAQPSDEPFAIFNVSLCTESRRLVVSGQSHVILLNFSKREIVTDVSTIPVAINCDLGDDVEPVVNFSLPVASVTAPTPTKTPSESSFTPLGAADAGKAVMRVKPGQRKWPVGFQPDLVALVSAQGDTHQTLSITDIAFNSHYGLLAIGTEYGIGIVDCIQHVCVACLATPDLYGSLDPFTRVKPRLPSLTSKLDDFNRNDQQHSSSNQTLLSTSGPGGSSAGSISGSASPLVNARHKRLAGAASVTGAPFSSSSTLSHSSLTATSSIAQTNPSSPTVVAVAGCASASASASGPPSSSSSSLFAEFKRTRSQKNLPAKSAIGAGVGPPVAYSPSKAAVASRTMSSSSLGYGIKEDQLAERTLDLPTHAQSSSTSSLEVVSQESIQSLGFYDSFARKSDSFLSPCLFVGTSLGSVIVLSIQLPEARSTQPVIVAPNNSLIRVKGAVQCVQLLDFRGCLLRAPAEKWEESRSGSGGGGADRDGQSASASASTSGYVSASGSSSVGGSGSTSDRRDRPLQSRTSSGACIGQQSPSGGSVTSDSMQQQLGSSGSALALAEKDKTTASYQVAVICSEKQARVLKLPSLACAFNTSLTETSVVLKASVFKFREEASVLGCHVANGHIMILSLPGLRPLLDCDVLPAADLRITRTLQFGAGGILTYFCSPSEVQLATVSAEDAAQLSELLALLYTQKQAPEPPKPTLMSMLFGGSSTAVVDREELFGDANSNMTKGTAKQITAATTPMVGAQEKASSVASEVRRTQMQLHERGERLSEVELKTEQMMNDSKVYSQQAHQLMMKFQQKKWYQF